MLSKLIFTSLLLAIVADVALACNGYKVKINKIETCPESLITFDPDFTIKLDSKCHLVPSGCISNKQFNTADAEVEVWKDGVKMHDGKTDMCDMAQKADGEAKEMMKLFHAPTKCPVQEEKICSNNHVVDISKWQGMMSMVKGTYKVKLQVKHNTGVSCIEADLEIYKK